MIKRALLGMLVCFLWLFLARSASAVDQVRPAFHEELGQAWDVIGREVQGLFDRWEDHFGSIGAREESPPISMITRNREKLGLSTEQVRNLERLRNSFEKESIRKEADIRVAKMDLRDLLNAQPVDMSKVEAKVQQDQPSQVRCTTRTYCYAVRTKRIGSPPLLIGWKRM